MSSEKNKKIDKALDIDIDKIISEADQEVDDYDKQQLKKYDERQQAIDTAKKSLENARNMSNKNWAEALLKKSAENIMISQEIFVKEIEEDPVSRNLTAMGELSNSLVSTVKTVRDLENDDVKIDQAQQKIDLRRRELESGGKEIVAGSGGNFVGQGTGKDILKLLKGEVIDAEGSEEG